MASKLLHYDVIDVLGEGAKSVIYRVSDPSTGRQLALKHVKRIDPKDIRFVEQIENEYEISRQFSHPNLRRSFDLKINKTMLVKVAEAFLVMELFEGRTIDVRPPVTMMDAVETALLERGVTGDRILIERFTVGRPSAAQVAAAEVLDQRAAGLEVTVILEGRRVKVAFDAEKHSILENARAAGMGAPFACKAGVCATCRASTTMLLQHRMLTSPPGRRTAATPSSPTSASSGTSSLTSR